jgi:hypothetical protein
MSIVLVVILTIEASTYNNYCLKKSKHHPIKYSVDNDKMQVILI